MVMPALAADEVEAPLIECALKVLVSMPAFDRIDFSHLAIVDGATGLYGFIRARKREDCFFSFLLSLVRSSRTRSAWTGHNLSLCGKAGKKNVVISFPGLDCFANFVGKKVTPSGLNCLKLMFRLAKSADLQGLTSAINIAVL